MPRYTFIILIGALLILAGPPAARAELRVALVSMERIFDEYHKTKEANALFTARADEMDRQRQSLLAKIKTCQSELETLNAAARDKSLKDSERANQQQAQELKLAQLHKAEEQLLEFDQSCKKQFGDQMRQTQQQIILEIRRVIQNYAQEHKISLVLDSSGKTLNNVEAVLFADPSFEITAAILAILNQSSTAPAAKPKAPHRK